jgi:glutathione S-transferase
MPNIIVYGGRQGTSFRVHWALHEAGVAYEAKPVDFQKGEHKSPDFLKMNPMGQVPVIDVDGFVLPESIAITEYVATKFAPQLLGSPENHAQVMRWSIWCMLNVNPPFGSLASVIWTKKELEPAVKEEKMAALARALPILEAQLQGKEFILGAFGLADMNVRSTFQYAEMTGFDLSAYPNVMGWMKRCEARPAYVAAKG